jgi:phosphatidylinositol phospholipase C beta
MRLNISKFEYNNRSGYLLKPDVLRRVDMNKPFDPFAESPLDGIVAATITIQVSFIGIPKFCQYYQCSLFDLNSDLKLKL